MISVKKIFSNMFLRNMLRDFGFNMSPFKNYDHFTTYFQYKIAPYQDDYYLYFPQKPYERQYKNEIFNKLLAYDKYRIFEYLQFHWQAYNNGEDFLYFLNCEISERLYRKPRNGYRLKLQSALEWVQKNQEHRAEHAEPIQQELPQNSPGTTKNQQKVSPEESSSVTNELAQFVTNFLPSGNIQLYNSNHEEKLVQILYLIQTAKVGKGDVVFKKFNYQDAASILHFHFDAFRDKKINTVEKYIKDCRDRLKLESPKVKKLIEALEDYFR